MRKPVRKTTRKATAKAAETPVVSKGRERRRKAGSGGLNQKLVMPPWCDADPDYVYTYRKDWGSRLHDLHSQDWDFVTESGQVVDRKSESVHKHQTGSNPDGSPQFQYFMRKLKIHDEADRAERQATVDENMNQIKSDAEAPSGARYKTDANIRMG